MKKNGKSFWITNISKMNVTLADLNVSIRAMSSVNLLSRNYHLTEETLLKSLSSGSLFAKRDKIVKRLVPPNFNPLPGIELDRNSSIPSRERSVLEIKIEKYEELELQDEKDELLNKEKEFELIAETLDTVTSS